ncbi:transcriptional regulator TbsP [Halovenus halobia]|uniref:transcriptional regulator TbsP n=1 Tax=Halovenus halobia TaxID=3396622 RepID=UPI003F54A7D2
MEQSDVHAETNHEVLRAGLDGATGDVLLVNPTAETLSAAVEMYRDDDSLPPLKVFVDSQPLKRLTDDFIIASGIADLVAEGLFEVRTLSTVPRHSLLLTEDGVLSFVQDVNAVAGLRTTEESFVSQLYDDYSDQWSEAEAFSLRTPPLSHVRETLETDIGAAAVEDFDRILDSLEAAIGDGEGLDEVTISLLVAANNGELLYDISRWGEDIRLASKATFSRNKNLLEEAGLIDTEKVPIDIGRPRLRLLLGDGSLESASIEEVAEEAEQRLGGN